MKSYFTQMNEEYLDRYYPDRSIFSSIHKSGNQYAIRFIILFGIMFIICAYYLISIFNKIIVHQNAIKPNIFALIFALFSCFYLPFMLWCIIETSLGGVKGRIKQGAKMSGYSESDIYEFEQQAIASDCTILEFTEKMDYVATGQKEGLLTKDFIFLGDQCSIIMKLDDIIGAFLVKRVYVLSQYRRVTRRIPYLSITLLSSKNTVASAETSPEMGAALISLLQEKNPQIETNHMKILLEKNFDLYRKETFAAHS